MTEPPRLTINHPAGSAELHIYIHQQTAELIPADQLHAQKAQLRSLEERDRLQDRAHTLAVAMDAIMARLALASPQHENHLQVQGHTISVRTEAISRLEAQGFVTTTGRDKPRCLVALVPASAADYQPQAPLFPPSHAA